MAMSDAVEASLEAVARDGVDIVPLFFERLFAAYPEQRDGFYRPQATQGAMVNEMLDYLLAIDADDGWIEPALEVSLAKHQSYGDIPLPVFEHALDILVQTMAEAAGSGWLPAYQALWEAKVEAMKQLMRKGWDMQNAAARGSPRDVV